MRRVAALPLAIAMGLAGSAACGRSALDGPPEAPGDASTLDAARDAKVPYVDAGVVDASAFADRATPVDSALEGASSQDATDALDARPEASTTDAGDAGDAGDASAQDASEAGPPSSACDECARGDQQCGPLPPVCTVDDGGLVQCGAPGQSIWTCVVGDAGCAVWDMGLACRPDVPCCVPCTHEYACPVGSLGDPCQQDTDCAFDACDARTHTCVPSQCADHRQDGQESDVDCGGQLCSACLTGQRCQSNFDCQSGHLCGPSHLCQ